MRRAWWLLVVFLLTLMRAAAQFPTVPSTEQAGILAWSNSATKGRFVIEWAPAATGQWQSSWSSLANIAATGGTYSVPIPMHVRVVHTYTPSEYPLHVSSQVLWECDGNSTAFSGMLECKPVVTGSLTITVGDFHVVDDGSGESTDGDLTVFIDYASGAYWLEFAGAPPAAGEKIFASYTCFDPPPPPPGTNTVTVTGEQLGTGSGIQTVFSGVLSHTHVIAGSVEIRAGGVTLLDEADGTLVGFNASGTVNYITGAWSIDLYGGPLGSGVPIRADYSYWAP